MNIAKYVPLLFIGLALAIILRSTELNIKIPKQLEQIETLEEEKQDILDNTEEIRKTNEDLKNEIKHLEKQLQAKREREAYLASLPTGCRSVEPIVKRYFGNQSTLVMAIMRAESGCNTLALNGRDNHGSCTGSYGLMQIGCFWFSYYGHSITYDPEVNIEIAYNIYKRQGSFNAWSAYKTGAYLKYL